MNYHDPKISKGQVERLARIYYRKFYASFGASLTVEDLEQEFWLVWHLVCERFDPARGFDFSAFLGISLRNKAMSLSRHYQRRSGLSAKSLDEKTGTEDMRSALVDLIEGHDEPVEQQIIRRQERTRITSQVDPRLQKMIALLEDTPAEFEREVEALQAKAAYAESLGISMRAPKELTLAMLSELVGVGRCARYNMIEKMQEIIDNG